ncbi:hypothetical protein MMC30_009346, partial [Trapelia coarctata]|nr:hypothetical protein [Trapelia coarctata]
MPSRNLTGYHELDPSSAPQLYLYNDDPQVSDRTTSLPEVISRKDVAAVSSREKPLPEGSKSNRKRNIILIAIACVLVLAAVGGGLGGYFAHRIQVQNQSIS